MNRNIQEQHLFEVDLFFSKIMSLLMFIVTFDQFNASFNKKKWNKTVWM